MQTALTFMLRKTVVGVRMALAEGARRIGAWFAYLWRGERPTGVYQVRHEGKFCLRYWNGVEWESLNTKETYPENYYPPENVEKA